jgi:hypothetical protein
MYSKAGGSMLANCPGKADMEGKGGRRAGQGRQLKARCSWTGQAWPGTKAGDGRKRKSGRQLDREGWA